MSRTLIHSEYDATRYTAPVGAMAQVSDWLTRRAEQATPPQCGSLVIAGQLVLGITEGDETYTIERDEALDIARALRAEIAEPGPNDEASLREHIGELADAVRELAERYDVLHLSLV